ncbi:MAG TPA: class II aldolase/adducin family protein [Acidimicrobiia bacterium]|nr:class II aldolase/adducin family protein [Acidimicrobiia bacterium]
MSTAVRRIAVADGSGVIPRTFAWSGEVVGERMRWLTQGLRAVMLDQGYTEVAEPGPEVAVVLHVLDPANARPYRRKNAPTFVVALAELDAPPDDVLRTGYPLLVRGLANLCVMISPIANGSAAHFVTLEQGTYAIESTAGDDETFFKSVFSRVEPLASSRLVIGNEFTSDLDPALWDGDDITEQITRAGERLDALDLLPAAFPIEEILSDRDLRHVKLLYGIGGLSYGNVSARRPVADGEPEPQFWMSASGVDKSSLHEIGRDILLVNGYDAARDVMLLSVPESIEPRRVSVDAIEHWMIYREHPEVGAILHVHAWIEGTLATEINFPCGTVELAESVAELVRQAPDPSRAVVGQRNHGLTITGHDLDEIFARIDGRIVRKVPMD